MNAVELVLKVNSAAALKNLSDVKTKLNELSNSQINPLDEKAVKKSADAFANSFNAGKSAAQELYARQQQIVAGMALAGQAGTKEFKSAQSELVNAKKSADEFEKALQKAMSGGGSSASAKLAQFGLMAQGVNQISNSLNELSTPFVKFEATLADFSALTGVSGDALADFGAKAKELAATFGGSASNQIEAFKGILSRLGPDIAKSPEALEKMGVAVNTLAKASGLDATASMQALTTSLLQFNVSLDDPISAANEMQRMMNVLAAGAKEGAAEIPQISEAVAVAGVAMSGAKISFEEGNAALQVLASGGKFGAEAGTALRNVLGMLQKASGPAEQALKKMGLSSKEMGEALTTQGVQSAMQKLGEGMNKLGTDAEKNAAMMEIFGMENASAAGILLKKADQIGALKDKITGTDTAFAQANTNMNTTASSIERFKANMENILIGVFDKIGGGAAAAVGALTSMQAPIMAISGIKSIIPEGSVGKLKDLGGSALSAVKGLTAQSVASGITAGATTVLTAAQSALNAAFVASPIGWIALGIAGVAATMYLLYQNVEPVRNAFDQAWIVIKSGVAAVWESLKGIVGGVGKLLTGDFAGAFEAFSSIGATASQAFGESVNKGLNDLNFDNAAKKAAAAMQKGAEINVKINSQSALENYVKEYELAQNKINALKSKKAESGLTSEEQKELDTLGAKAQATAEKIGKIAPETRENFKTVVDASGNIKEAWDVNIAKAREFTSSQKNNGDLKAAASDYSNALLTQAGVLDNQIERQKALKIQIDKTNDTDAKQKLIDKYNEENKAIDATKQKIIANFQEGAKAGLLTNAAFDALGKQLGITGDQARKMALAKELEEAGKKGVITDSTVKALAEKYGVTYGEAQNITAEQKKITDETNKSKQAAMGWGEAVGSIKNAQAKAQTAVKEAIKAYNDGKISEKEKNETIAASTAEMQKQNAEMKKFNAASKEAANIKGLQVVQEIDAAKTEKKSAKEKESAYDAAKRAFEQNAKSTEQTRKQSELDAQIAAARSGAAKSALDETKSQITANAETLSIYQSQLTTAKELLETAKNTKGAKDKAEDVKDATARVDELNTKLKELTLKDLTLNLKFASDLKEFDKIERDIKIKNLKKQIDIAIDEKQFNDAKSKILELKDLLTSKSNDLKISLKTEVNPNAKEKLIEESETITKDINSYSKSLNDTAIEEKFANIKNANERELRISFEKIELIHDEEIKAAGNSATAKLTADQKYYDAKTTAAQKYLSAEKTATVAALEAINEFGKNVSFDFKKPDNSAAKAVEKDISKLKAQYTQGKISANEYYNQLDELEVKLQDSQVKRQNAFLQGINGGLSAAASSFQKTSSKMLADAMENYRKTSDAGADTTAAMDAVMSSAVDNIAVSGVAALASGKNVAKAMIANAFDMLQAMVPIWTAQIAGFSLASAESIATFGIAGLAKAALITGLLTVAIQGAKAAVTGFFTGGDTGRNVRINEVAGVVHGQEYVVNHQGAAFEGNRKLAAIMNKGVDVSALLGESVAITLGVVGDFANLEKSFREYQRETTNEIRGMREDFKKLQFDRKTTSKLEVVSNITLDDKKLLKEQSRSRRVSLKNG